MRYDIIISLLFSILFLGSCVENSKARTRKDEEQRKTKALDTSVSYPVTVNLQEAIANVDTNVCLSTFVESIEYIPLKLKNYYLGDRILQQYYDEQSENFFFCDMKKVLRVNKDGTLSNTIGRLGQGPGEYAQVSRLSIDDIRKNVYIYDGLSRRMLKFDYTGKSAKNLFRVTGKKITSDLTYYNGNFLSRSDIYVFRPQYPQYVDLLYGFGIHDTLGNLIEMTPPLHSRLKGHSRDYVKLISPFATTCYKDVLIVTDAELADTIYTVSNEHFVPRYILDYGDKQPDIQKIWNRDPNIREAEIKRTIYTRDLPHETSRYFFMRCRFGGDKYVVCYDKYEKRHFSVKYDDSIISDKGLASVGFEHLFVDMAFRNDIDGGIDAYIGTASTLGNYWFITIDAYALKTLLTDKFFAGRTEVLDKNGQMALKMLVDNLDDEDDQVIMLMKLKASAK